MWRLGVQGCRILDVNIIMMHGRMSSFCVHITLKQNLFGKYCQQVDVFIYDKLMGAIYQVHLDAYKR